MAALLDSRPPIKPFQPFVLILSKMAKGARSNSQKKLRTQRREEVTEKVCMLRALAVVLWGSCNVVMEWRIAVVGVRC